ncbi:MAG: acyl-CoA thioesterase [Bdellovibrionota bacterium]
MFTYEKRIPFYDVDPMQVVWHGNYVKYLEEARCAFLSTKKMTYADMDDLGYAFPIVELKLKYIKPCVFDEDIMVLVNLVSYENMVVFKYEIRNKENGELKCKAETRQMCVCMKTKESLFEVPKEVVQKLV